MSLALRSIHIMFLALSGGGQLTTTSTKRRELTFFSGRLESVSIAIFVDSSFEYKTLQENDE